VTLVFSLQIQWAAQALSSRAAEEESEVRQLPRCAERDAAGTAGYVVELFALG
jgi:hypothetical protein